jgi:hypothetical protein
LLIVAAILAPIGAAVCRQPRLAVIWLLWAVVNIGVASLGGFSGARLRVPFEPLMIVLAAVAVSGGWRLRPRWLVPAVAAGVVSAVAVLPQVPRSLAGWPDYGVEWPSIWVRDSGRIIGPAGVNVPAFGALAEFSIAREPSTANGTTPVDLQIRGAGVMVESRTLVPGDTQQFRIWWPRRGLAFLRIDATDLAARRDLRIVVPR